jgi:tetratricopeptide (TPR) repeat protein
MASRVARKKLLKEPDEFLTISSRAIQWSRKNLKIVGVIAFAVVVLLVAVLSIKAYLDYHQREAAAALAPVMAGYQAVVEGKADQKAMVSLAARLKKVTDDYGTTPAGLQARLALGDVQLTLGRYAPAVVTFQALTEEPDMVVDLAPLAWRGLGQAQEGTKDYKAASVAYGRAIALAGPNLGRLTRLDQARVLAAGGDKDGAAAIYRQLLAEPGTPDELSGQARSALAAMGLEPLQGS